MMTHCCYHTKALDADQGNNAAIRYAIIGGNTQSRFSVDSLSGAVSLVKALDYQLLRRCRLVIRAQGFLLTERWILTSSHCFLVDPLFKKLQAGRVYMGTATVPVSKASLKQVQLRIISDVKILPSGVSDDNTRGSSGGEEKAPCSAASNKSHGGGLQESRCVQTKLKYPSETTEDDTETEYDEPQISPEDQEDMSAGQLERAVGSGELALVQVDDKFEINKYVAFIRLGNLPFPGRLECRAIGFTDDNPPGPRKRIHWKTVEVWNGTKCNLHHKMALDGDSLCSKGPPGRPGCPEDVGGPLVCVDTAAALIAYSWSERSLALYGCQPRVGADRPIKSMPNT